MHFATKSAIYLLYAGLQICNGLPSSADSLQIPFIDQAAASKSQHKALTEAGIIPDVLDDFEPSVSIHLSYPSKHKSVKLGNSIKPKHVDSRPNFDIYASEATPSRTLKSNATYVLALTDPDAMSRSDPAKAQMCHWIAMNITVSSSASVALDVSEIRRSGSDDLIKYLPPTPPPKTGYHRYVFVVLAPDSDDDLDLKKPKDRPHWGYGRIGAGVREWAEENSLVVLGANFFYAQHKKQ